MLRASSRWRCGWSRSSMPCLIRWPGGTLPGRCCARGHRAFRGRRTVPHTGAIEADRQHQLHDASERERRGEPMTGFLSPVSCLRSSVFFTPPVADRSPHSVPRADRSRYLARLLAVVGCAATGPRAGACSTPPRSTHRGRCTRTSKTLICMARWPCQPEIETGWSTNDCGFQSYGQRIYPREDSTGAQKFIDSGEQRQ